MKPGIYAIPKINVYYFVGLSDDKLWGFCSLRNETPPAGIVHSLLEKEIEEIFDGYDYLGLPGDVFDFGGEEG